MFFRSWKSRGKSELEDYRNSRKSEDFLITSDNKNYGIDKNRTEKLGE